MCNITFNDRKSVYIKFGDKLNDYEKVMLTNSEIKWVTELHLRNSLDKTHTDLLDCRKKLHLLEMLTSLIQTY